MTRLPNQSLQRTILAISHLLFVATGMMWTKVVFGKNVLANMFVLNVLEIIQHSNVQGYPSQIDIQFTHSQFLVQPKCGVMLSVYQIPTQSQCVTSRYKRVLAPIPQSKRNVSNESRHSHSVLTPDTEQALVFYTCYQCIKSQHSHSVLPPDTNVCWPQFPSANAVYQMSPDTVTVC